MNIKMRIENGTAIFEPDLESRLPLNVPRSFELKIPLDNVAKITVEKIPWHPISWSGVGAYLEKGGWAFYMIEMQDRCITIYLKKPIYIFDLGLIKYNKVVIEFDSVARIKAQLERKLKRR